MAISGDFRKLQKLVVKAADAPSKMMRVVSKVMAEATIDLVKEGFSQQRDPYGRPWAPRHPNSIRTSGPILRDSSRLWGSFSRSDVSEKGFRVGTNVKYAAIHQFGGEIVPKKAKALAFWVPGSYQVFSARGKRLKKPKLNSMFLVLTKKVTMPQRAMMPIKTIPKRWMDAYREVVDEVVRDYFEE